MSIVENPVTETWKHILGFNNQFNSREELLHYFKQRKKNLLIDIEEGNSIEKYEFKDPNKYSDLIEVIEDA